MLLSDEFKDTIIREVKIESLKILTQRDNQIETPIINNIYALLNRTIGYNLCRKDRVVLLARKAAEHIEANLDYDQKIPELLFEYIQRIVCQEIRLEMDILGFKNF